MGLVATERGTGNFEPAPVGTHPARCVRVIDLGTQYSAKWDNYTHKVLLGWELPTKMKKATSDQTEEPIIVSSQYTLSLHKKAALRGILESWRSKPFSPHELRGFELKRILGKECMVNILHNKSNGTTYANVAAVKSVPKGVIIPEQFHYSIYFSIDQWDERTFDSLENWLQQKIKNSIEYQSGLREEEFAQEDAVLVDDDVPF